MGLVDLLRGIGKKKADNSNNSDYVNSTPLSRRRIRHYIDGRTEFEDWTDPAFAEEVSRLRGKYSRFIDMARNESEGRYNENIEDFLDYNQIEKLADRLMNKNIVIRNPKGFHYGKLIGFDGNFFYLDRYLSAKKMKDKWSYRDDSFFNSKGRVPASYIASLEKIPSHVYDPEQFLYDSIAGMAAERLYGDFKGQDDISFGDYFGIGSKQGSDSYPNN